MVAEAKFAIKIYSKPLDWVYSGLYSISAGRNAREQSVIKLYLSRKVE